MLSFVKAHRRELFLTGVSLSLLISLRAPLWRLCVWAFFTSAEEDEIETAALAAEAGVPPSSGSAAAMPTEAEAAVRASVPTDVSSFFLLASPFELYAASEGAALGAGGFGSVTRGTAIASGEPVALKCFKQREFDQALMGRLLESHRGNLSAAASQAAVDHLREQWELECEESLKIPRHEIMALQAVKGLHSPFFIDMLTAHCHEGHFYVATALAGRTLESLLPELPLKERLAVLQRVASALADLHAAGCAHRDIKPDNIAVRPGTLLPVLLDVGLLKLPEGLPDPFPELGCVPFLAPEWYSGGSSLPERVLVQARDVFALGLSMASLLFCPNPSVPFTALVYHLSGAGVGFEAYMARSWKESDVRAALSFLWAKPGHLVDLIVSMLNASPERRPTMAQVASHPAFAAAHAETELFVPGSSPPALPALG